MKKNTFRGNKDLAETYFIKKRNLPPRYYSSISSFSIFGVSLQQFLHIFIMKTEHGKQFTDNGPVCSNKHQELHQSGNIIIHLIEVVLFQFGINQTVSYQLLKKVSPSFIE